MEIGWMMESGTLLNIRGTQKKKIQTKQRAIQGNPGQFFGKLR